MSVPPNNNMNPTGMGIPNQFPPMVAGYGYPMQMPYAAPGFVPPVVGAPMMYPSNVPYVPLATNLTPPAEAAAAITAKKLATAPKLEGAAGLAGKTAADWQEFTDQNSGKKYYYNKVTKKTQWEKPQELEEAEKSIGCVWQEAVTKEGKKYYFNAITQQSLWEMPNEYKEYLEKQQGESTTTSTPTTTTTTSSSSSTSAESEAVPADSKPTKIVVDPLTQAAKKPVVQSKEEAKTIFKKLLEDSGVQTSWDWPTTMRKIINDERYKVIKTVNEKKDVFHEYIEDRRRKEKEERRVKRQKYKEDFMNLLAETKALSPQSSYRNIVHLIDNDLRFHAVDREEDRVDWFDEYVRGLGSKLRREKEERRSQAMLNFKKLLERKCEEGLISHKSVWRKIEEKLENEDEFRNLDKVDRMHVWDSFIKDVKKVEDEKKTKDREKRKKAEKKNRSAYWNVMTELHKEGKMSILTKWKEFKPLVRETEAYKNVKHQSGPSPKHLFNEFLSDLDLRYKEDKRRMKLIMNDSNFSLVMGETSYEQFFTVISKDERFQSIDGQNVKIFFEEAMERAKEKEKKKNKTANKFRDLLEDTPEITISTTFEECQKLLAGKSAFTAIESTEEREKLFNEHIHMLQRKEERKRKRESGATEPIAEESSPKKQRTGSPENEELLELERRKQQILHQLNQAS